MYANQILHDTNLVRMRGQEQERDGGKEEFGFKYEAAITYLKIEFLFCFCEQ